MRKDPAGRTEPGKHEGDESSIDWMTRRGSGHMGQNKRRSHRKGGVGMTEDS